MLLTASQIHKQYGQVTVLRGVDIQIQAGEIACIVGSSGAGKSTLLHILGTLDKPDQGQVTIDGVRTDQLSGRKLADFRNRELGFIFQFHHLLPEFTALENICMPAWIAKTSKSAAEKKAKELLNLLGLTNRQDHKPEALSGGEQQRVAVARALINNPKIVFADEPTGNLDSANARALHQLFVDLRAAYQQTFLIVTHNEELSTMSDRVLHMKDGQMVNLP